MIYIRSITVPVDRPETDFMTLVEATLTGAIEAYDAALPGATGEEGNAILKARLLLLGIRNEVARCNNMMRDNETSSG